MHTFGSLTPTRNPVHEKYWRHRAIGHPRKSSITYAFLEFFLALFLFRADGGVEYLTSGGVA